MSRLKELRKRKNISLNKLRKTLKDEYDISVSDSQLMYYENEIRKPRDERIWSALADFFGVSIGYLLGYEVKEQSILEQLQSVISRLKLENLSDAERVEIRKLSLELLEETLK